MALISKQIQIDAPPSSVWAVVREIERWPEWTASVNSARLVRGEAFTEGAEYRVAQMRGMAPTWRITRIDEGRSFDWEMRPMPGARVVGSHVLEPHEGGTLVTLTIRSTGPLAALLTPMLAPMSRRNLPIEAEGLKRRAESAS